MKKIKVGIKGITPYLQKFNNPYKDSKGNYCIPNFQIKETLLEGVAMKAPHLREQVMRCIEIKPECIELKYRNVKEEEIDGEKFLMFEDWRAEFEIYLSEDSNDLENIEKKEIEEILRMWGKSK